MGSSEFSVFSVSSVVMFLLSKHGLDAECEPLPVQTRLPAPIFTVDIRLLGRKIAAAGSHSSVRRTVPPRDVGDLRTCQEKQ